MIRAEDVLSKSCEALGMKAWVLDRMVRIEFSDGDSVDLHIPFQNIFTSHINRLPLKCSVEDVVACASKDWPGWMDLEMTGALRNIESPAFVLSTVIPESKDVLKATSKLRSVLPAELEVVDGVEPPYPEGWKMCAAAHLEQVTKLRNSLMRSKKTQAVNALDELRDACNRFSIILKEDDSE